MSKSLTRAACLVTFAASASGWLCGPSPADEFFAGKSIQLIVGYGSGGGYDVYGRLLARHIARHIPGQPHIIVQNMPGAASLTAIRHQDAIAPKDGTVITLFDFVQIANSVIDPQKSGLNFRKYHWIGSISEDLSVCYVWAASDIKTLAELRQRPQVHMGLTAVGDAQDIRLKLLKRLLGVNVKAVAGYPSTGSQYFALERGELEAGCGGWSSLPLNWRTESKINVLVKFAPHQPLSFPSNVPYASDLIADNSQRKVLQLLNNPSQLGKPLLMSQAVPAERVQVVRDAFAVTMKDPLFLADADRLKVDISPKFAAESEQIIDEIYAMPPEVIDAARRIIGD